MKFFPTDTYRIKLAEDPQIIIDLLKMNTLESYDLSSQVTSKMFIGKFRENNFKIVSSEMGIGPFAVFTGSFDKTELILTAEVHHTFKVLISILYLFPIIMISISIPEYGIKSIGFLFPISMLILFIRFIFTSLAYRFSFNLTKNKLKMLKIELE